ncbi:MAG: MBL fold metallo-hydrolase, partial [Sphingobacteriales bacterium]
MGKDTDVLNRHFGFNPQEIDIVVLSHAHIDHTGLLPKLVSEGFRGKIYCTPATKELASVLLEDSAQIQVDDVRYVNKRRALDGLPYLKPLYTVEDAIEVRQYFKEIDYDVWTSIDENVDLLYSDAGHIIGSAVVNLSIKENGKQTNITFSGDVGRYRDVILRSPANFPPADIIILESTYGNSLHDLHKSTPDDLLKWIEKTCLEKKGKLIIPAFSVGRTQEILFALNQLELERRLPDLEYFVDSPLSIKATEIVKRYPEYFNRYIQKILTNDEDPFKFKGLKYIRSVDESKLLNFRNEPCVIISASGMA